MGPLSKCVIGAAAYLLMSSCSKHSDTNQIDLPGTSLSQIAKNSSLKKHRPVLYKVEYLGARNASSAGKAILYNDKKTRPSSAFVARDPRRQSGQGLSYMVANKYSTNSGSNIQQQSAAFDRAMNSWAGTNCSRLSFRKLQPAGAVGYISSLLGFGGSQNYMADIVHAGFLDAAFFDQIVSGGSGYILAATFTLIFFDENGMPTDIDKNGANDIAFQETYYNNNFNWTTSSSTDYDIESVALHETGHALGLGHYGKGELQRNGQLKFSPRAVMNPVYQGVLREIKGPDKSYECLIWKNWIN